MATGGSIAYAQIYQRYESEEFIKQDAIAAVPALASKKALDLSSTPFPQTDRERFVQLCTSLFSLREHTVNMSLNQPFNAETGVALLSFNEEAAVYCQGISDGDAHEYAMNYASMLCSRAKGLEFETRTRYSPRLFEPNRNLIKSMLDKIYRKYFAN